MWTLENRRTVPSKLDRLGTALFSQSFGTENKKSKLLTKILCQKIVSQDVDTSLIKK